MSTTNPSSMHAAGSASQNLATPGHLQDIPSNLYKLASPLQAKLIKNQPLCGEGSPNDVRHLVFSLEDSDYRYLEGQSAGIIPPGFDAMGKPHKLRLYSIASPGYGDDGEGKTLSLCVKRVVYNDPETGEERRGVCSNYLCDMKEGTPVQMTGPVGKSFLMPSTPNANIIMVATGTGIAPFRAFLHNRYEKRTQETGQSWLFFGAQTQKDFLYKDEFAHYAENDTFRLITAFSREQQTQDGKRMYVQHRIEENAAEMFTLLAQPNTYFYICGLKGMESGILEGMYNYCTSVGQNWEALLSQMKAEKRWHIEVY